MKQIVRWRSIQWMVTLLPLVVVLVVLNGAWGAVRAATVASGDVPQKQSALAGPRPIAIDSMLMPGGIAISGHLMAAKPATGTIIRLHQKVVRVTIFNFAFKPVRLVVSPGTRIIWTNKDSDPHTVDSTTNLWSSDALDTNNMFARVFRKVGSFSYYCSVHPFMHGEIIVKK